MRNLETWKSFGTSSLVHKFRNKKMEDRDAINECRRYVVANEAAAKEYLSRYFIITEYSLSELGATVFSEFAYMLVEDIEKIPEISYSKNIYLPPVAPTQLPEAIIWLKWMNVPDHLRNLKCYRLAPKTSIITPSYKLFEGLPEDLKREEHEMLCLLVFHFSSFLALMHRRFPLTEEAIREYDKHKSLEELKHLASGL